MTEKLYYWAENLDGYSSDNEQDQDQTIEIKRLNFFIGKNNAGKSRFLRSLFLNNYPSNFYNNLTLRKNIKSLKENIFQIESFSYSTTKSDLQRYIKELFRDLNDNNTDQLTFLNSSINQILNRDSKISSLFPDFQQTELTKENVTQLDQLFIKKFHIPILRGMRPVTELANKQPYIERAQKDYFSDKEKYNSSNIITGESLYHELKEHLLGEPEQREIIRKYEEKLSQYFFDNETITLIPKHDQDVVNIKIGSDKQFPISELGDGLQQVIILTYEAFIKKDETHAFFIEEPELHMHAGMVRQLMNFYLNETNHYYFFTTHSNHLLDMADESDQVIIQKFVKQPKENPRDGFDFKIYRCDRDRDLLASLGVKPSSVYLANCTIWVEGITDRLYITKYMEKYLVELKNSDEELYKKYRRFMPNYHYTFVEYAGSNLVHWDFSDEFTDHLNDQGMNALLTTSSVLLIADGDIQGKGNRVEQLTESLGKQFYLLPCKETENTLPANIIHYACNIKFSGLEIALSSNLELSKILKNYLSMDGMQTNTKDGFDITQLLSDQNYFHAKDGIGKIIDSKIKIGNPRTSDDKPKKCFADASGTIKDKLKFCRLILTLMDHVEWTLTDSAKELCKTIFEHIDESNNAKL
ncbi:AAA family ATPase [Acinetobacter johnsonii]|uniref:AAA family ATPase n=1 Tax=Acinetobacter johnsonii TaxID=40214 RepID=UPI000738A885|nr:AAA family ATPase [Acinetobacter johnsonii]AXF44702.1 ATP-binding protein [Acinetobacter johnsonii]KUG37948.1 AAA domain protein [Acinetobacter johnsonii]MDH1276323.1 ATP-binding protein [Acinetobacter johnsonii]MDQ8973617.1 AAA family ATPase [Acinetobacter johnsonii]